MPFIATQPLNTSIDNTSKQSRVKNKFAVVATAISMGMFSVGSFAEVKAPELDNTAYVLMDYSTGQVLAQKNPNKPLPPASLTKMMTSYIVEERLMSGKLKEDDQILVTQAASCAIGGGQSCMYVLPDTTASAIDILRGIVIQSGNDASIAAAEHLAGNEASFANMMNDYAKDIGMENTNFVNATGMPADNHYSSAMDLAKLARTIIKNSGDYYKIYAEKEFSYNGINQANRNSLLKTDPTVDGLKTGHTNAAGYCLAASSSRDNMRLISVILGAKSSKARAEQSRQLLNWGYGHFETIVKAPKGQYATQAPVIYGQQNEVELAAADDLKVLTEADKETNIETIFSINDNIKAPITKGQALGTMSAVVNGKVISTVDLVATHDVAEAGLFKKIWQGAIHWVKGLFK